MFECYKEDAKTNAHKLVNGNKQQTKPGATTNIIITAKLMSKIESAYTQGYKERTREGECTNKWLRRPPRMCM